MRKYGANVTRDGSIIRATIDLEGDPTDDLSWVLQAMREGDAERDEYMNGYYETVMLSQHLAAADDAGNIADELAETVLSAVGMTRDCNLTEARRKAIVWIAEWDGPDLQAKKLAGEENENCIKVS